MSTFKVEEMSCAHCVKSITEELTKGDDTIRVKVDLAAKTVTVENLKDDRVLFLLSEIGYNAEKL